MRSQIWWLSSNGLHAREFVCFRLYVDGEEDADLAGRDMYNCRRLERIRGQIGIRMKK